MVRSHQSTPNFKKVVDKLKTDVTLIALKMKKEVRHRPATWMKITGITVLDPDGWRCDNKSMYLPLTEEEWNWRQAKSTCMTKKRD